MKAFGKLLRLRIRYRDYARGKPVQQTFRGHNQAGGCLSEIALENIAVIGMNSNRDAAQQSRDPANHTGFGGVSVDNVGLLPQQNPRDAHQADQVRPSPYRPRHAGDLEHAAGVLQQVAHVLLSVFDRAHDQPGVK